MKRTLSNFERNSRIGSFSQSQVAIQDILRNWQTSDRLMQSNMKIDFDAATQPQLPTNKHFPDIFAYKLISHISHDPTECEWDGLIDTSKRFE